MATIPSNVIPFKVPSIAREAYQYTQREQLREERQDEKRENTARGITDPALQGFSRIPQNFGGREALQMELDEIRGLSEQYAAGDKSVYNDLVTKKEGFMAAISGALSLNKMIDEESIKWNKDRNKYVGDLQGFSDLRSKNWTADELRNSEVVSNAFFESAPKPVVAPPKYVEPEKTRNSFFASPMKYVKVDPSSSGNQFSLDVEGFTQHVVTEMTRMVASNPEMALGVILHNEAISGNKLDRMSQESMDEFALKYNSEEMMKNAIDEYAKSVVNLTEVKFEKEVAYKPTTTSKKEQTTTDTGKKFLNMVKRAYKTDVGYEINAEGSGLTRLGKEEVYEKGKLVEKPKKLTATKILLSDDYKDAIIYWDDDSTTENAMNAITNKWGVTWRYGLPEDGEESAEPAATTKPKGEAPKEAQIDLSKYE